MFAAMLLAWSTIAPAAGGGDDDLPPWSRATKPIASVPVATPPAAPVVPASSAAGATAQQAASGQNRPVARQRPVDIDFSALNPQRQDAPATIDVQLFDGQVVTLERDRVEPRGPNNYTWYGWIKGQDTGQAILTVVDGEIAGSITIFDGDLRGGKVYQVHSNRDGTFSLQQIDQKGFPPDHPAGAENGATAPHDDATSSSDGGGSTTSGSFDATATSGDTGTTIDVMVVYSNQTAAAAGTAIGAQIQQAIDSANTAYANSGVTTRLRLVHFQQVNYSESGDFNTDLNRLTSATDGYMDEVATLRNNHGADLVSLFVENGQYCGIAWIGPSANYGFSVVNRSCASGNLSFAHELGHNFGARHDPYVDASNTPYAHGHGFTNATDGWRTVMAYNNACAAAGTSCVRVPYFSTPNLTYGNPPDPLGTATTSDNVRVHNDGAATVAGFRTAVTAGCTYSLSPESASIAAGSASGSVAVASGAGCAWNAASNASWLVIGANSGTSGNGTLYYSATANTGPARSAMIAVGDKSFTVSQATSCTYTLSPTSASVGEGGGTGSTTLTTNAGCAWNTGSSATWLTVTTATTGTGSATIGWSAAANTGSQRSANLNIGGATFTVTEAAASTPPTAAVATLSATSVKFGNVKVGSTSSTKSVTLTNTGGGTLTITSLNSGGANPGEFDRAGTCAVNTALAAGQSCSLQHTFTPAASGNRSASTAVATSAGTVTLGLSGRGSTK